MIKLRQNKRKRCSKILKGQYRLTEKMMDIGNKNFIILENSTKVDSTCIGCPDLPCIYFRDEEYSPNIIEGVPHNKENKICIVDAIRMDDVSGYPGVDNELCILCGLCLQRCPTGAINICFKTQKIVLNHKNSEIFREVSYDKNNIEIISTYDLFLSLPQKYNLKYSPLQSMGIFVNEIENIIKEDSYVENIIIRNFLLVQDLPTIVRVRGDTNFRIELLSKFNSNILISEVDFNQLSLLETPRALLDNIAVLAGRYKICAKRIIPIVFCLSFPNKRTDYYEVISDIYNILNIQIKTISLSLLFILTMYKICLCSLDIIQYFNVNKENYGIISDINKIIPSLNKLELFKYARYFEATK